MSMASRPKHIVLIGPPGSGKSTLSEQLIQRAPLTVIASGKRLRNEIRQGSAIGRQIEALLDQGHFAPDLLMDKLMREWLTNVPPDHGFLLDGYPRSRKQAFALEGMLADLKRPLDLVIALDLSTEEAIRRLSGRRICEGGGEPFTLHIDDVAAMHRCWERGGHLVQRDDDRAEVIAERLHVYAEQTQPLVDFYQQDGRLRMVDAHGAPNEVVERVLALLNDMELEV
jgi:adenylate kinase